MLSGLHILAQQEAIDKLKCHLCTAIPNIISFEAGVTFLSSFIPDYYLALYWIDSQENAQHSLGGSIAESILQQR